jgi:hypothetical protein
LIDKLLNEIEALKRENMELRALVKQQNETIKQLQQALYGRSSEQSNAVNPSPKAQNPADKGVGKNSDSSKKKDFPPRKKTLAQALDARSKGAQLHPELPTMW